MPLELPPGSDSFPLIFEPKWDEDGSSTFWSDLSPGAVTDVSVLTTTVGTELLLSQVSVSGSKASVAY